MTTNLPKLIGLTGATISPDGTVTAGTARVGKDTVGAILVDEYGYRRISVADNIRTAALGLDPIIDGDRRLSEIVDNLGWEQAKAIPEVRRTLQRLGTEAGTDVHGQSLWLDLVGSQIDADSTETPVVITDVRMPHELDWIRARGGLVWEVRRPVDNLLTSENSAHASERRAGEPDVVVNNDSTLDALADAVAAALVSSMVETFVVEATGGIEMPSFQAFGRGQAHLARARFDEFATDLRPDEYGDRVDLLAISNGQITLLESATVDDNDDED